MELVSETTKLKTSEHYSDIQVVADEEKETRYAKALLRQAAYLAKQRGDRVWQRHDLIWVNGVKYTVDLVEKIPDELRFKNRRTGNAQEAEERNKGETQRERPKEQGPVRDDKRGEDMDVTAPQDIGSEQF